MINEAAGLMPPPHAPLPTHPHLQPTPQTAPGRASLSELDLGQGAALPANPLDKVSAAHTQRFRMRTTTFLSAIWPPIRLIICKPQNFPVSEKTTTQLIRSRQKLIMVWIFEEIGPAVAASVKTNTSIC